MLIKKRNFYVVTHTAMMQKLLFFPIQRHHFLLIIHAETKMTNVTTEQVLVTKLADALPFKAASTLLAKTASNISV